MISNHRGNDGETSEMWADEVALFQRQSECPEPRLVRMNLGDFSKQSPGAVLEIQKEAVRIVTSGRPWSYAASLLLVGPNSDRKLRRVNVEIELRRGSTVIGVLTQDGRRWLTQRAVRESGKRVVELTFDSSKGAILMVTNGDGTGGEPGEVLIRSVSMKESR